MSYIEAKKRYAALGIDTDAAIEKLKNVPVALHCWQGDDVRGFDTDPSKPLTGGIQTTGNYPGRARTPEELMADLDVVLKLCPGTKKMNLHASYAIFENGDWADRDALEPKHFAKWVEFCKERGLGCDFNPTFFSHPKANGLTLSSPDPEIRKFWIEHGKACIRISNYLAKELHDYGVPVILPAGGLGCHLNAGAFVPELPHNEYPAAAVAAALYIAGGIRGMERGTLSEQRNPDGTEPYSELELMRLAVPRRVYTLSQLKYVADRVKWLWDNRSLIGGLEWVEEPTVLRFFSGRLKEKGYWQEQLAEKFRKDFGESL